MSRTALFSTLLLTLAFLVPAAARGQARDRATTPPEFTWNLADIYPSDEAWAAAKDKLAGRFDEITPFKGKVLESPQRLLACLDLNSQIGKEAARLYCYASMKSDEDTRVSKYQGMTQQLRQMLTGYGAKASFIGPEIAASSEAAIDAMIAQEPRLKPYSMYLHDVLRTKAHRLSIPEETILAQAGLMASTPGTVNSIFTNADLPFPEIALADGSKAKLDVAGFCRFRASANRDDRRAVFNAFFGALGQFERTFGTHMAAEVNKDMFFARARKYESTLHGALDDGNIPVAVYHSLIENVNKNLPTFHRFLRLKQRMLGVEQLEYIDAYAPTVAKVDMEYAYPQSREIVLAAVKPLGPEYVAAMKRAFDERWIDVYPSTGKRPGAYSNGGCYDVHPYILLNYNGQYEDMTTLAHELGHTMHSYHSNKTQPFPTADYSIFVAEVASTLNEALLFAHVLDTIQDDDARLSLLMTRLDGVRQTVFRQTQFAEFELAIHEKAESGAPLTGDVLSKMYGDIARKYYGHDQGVCLFDKKYDVEWAFVPHFYYDYYVYQYATSFTASTAMAERILNKEPGAVKKTIRFLSAGGSQYPIDILKDAGVDMTTGEPFEKTMAMMNHLMDEIEKILDKKEKAAKGR